MPTKSQTRRRRYMGYPPMAERIQLKEPGSELVMLVKQVTPQTVERNDYYLFTNGKVELLVPQSSVNNQLERLDITAVEGMTGKTVRFGRSMKMSRANKPFWDIGWASGAETPSAGGDLGKPTAGTTSAAPSAEPAKPKMRDTYKDLTKWVIKEVAPLYNDTGSPDALSDETIAAITATLFIQACRAGKVE